MTDPLRELRVFLCHASPDKPIVRELYQRLNNEDWIDPWLDEEKLLPGQDWDLEIEKAVEAADAVIVWLSNKSVNKEGYVQRELRFALDIALEKPEGTIFVIPLKLEECEPPRKLRAWHYVEYFPVEQRSKAYQRLLRSLVHRAEKQNVVVSKDDLSTSNIDHISDQKPEYTGPKDQGSANEKTYPPVIVDDTNFRPQAPLGLWGTTVTFSRVLVIGSIVGALYFPVFLVAAWIFNNNVIFQNVEWLIPLGGFRGLISSYLVLRQDLSKASAQRGAIGGLVGLFSGLPFLIVAIAATLILPLQGLDRNILWLMFFLDMFMGVIVAGLLGLILPNRKNT